MLNQVIMVGRLVADPEVKENDNGKKYTNATIAVQRSYKNADGVYETDFVDCTLFDGLATNTFEYCRKGDIIGVKGKVQTSTYEKDGEKRKSMQIIADKITFLSSKAKEINDEIDKDNNDDLDM